MDPVVRYADIDLHRPIAEVFNSLDRIASRIDDSGSTLGATRVYRVGSRLGYRLWGAWAPVGVFPLIISVAPSPRDSPNSLSVRLVSNEGRPLYRIPDFFRQADRAVVHRIAQLRKQAGTGRSDEAARA